MQNRLLNYLIELTSPNIYQAIIDYQKSVKSTVSEDEMDKKLTQIINPAELKTTSQTAIYVETDGQTDIKFSVEFIDAMYEYTYTYAVKQLN